MRIYLAIAFTCMLYFAVIYYMLQFADEENFLGYYVIALFFTIFFYLGLGGVEITIKLFLRK
jgi:hypothetical protein